MTSIGSKQQGIATTKKIAAEWNVQQRETTQRHHHPCWEIRTPQNRGKGKQLNAMGMESTTVNLENRREGTPEKGIVLFQCRRIQLVIQKKGRHAQLLQESQRLAHLHHCSGLPMLNAFLYYELEEVAPIVNGEKVVFVRETRCHNELVQLGGRREISRVNHPWHYPLDVNLL